MSVCVLCSLQLEVYGRTLVTDLCVMGPSVYGVSPVSPHVRAQYWVALGYILDIENNQSEDFENIFPSVFYCQNLHHWATKYN